MTSVQDSAGSKTVKPGMSMMVEQGIPEVIYYKISPSGFSLFPAGVFIAG